MATIKDGNGATDQVGVLPVAKSLKVTLVDALGNLNSVPLATSTTGALEANGNLAALVLRDSQAQTELLRLILIELRVMTALLGQGLNVPDDPDTYRNEPMTIELDVVNS